ncbi:cyclic nucleotide-binding domain-containing protein [Rhodophyticola porphyridii]|uniref:cyclic nucleotide-binding domain-containing protein n=1 Tax=Rhodophyticola porphyridii TaxID=1852017 RepID=UPI0035D01061
MRDNDVPEIRSLPLFQEMEDENFEALIRGAYVQTFPPQVELITEGDPADFLHVVISGSVELFAAWNRRQTTMATVRPISTFILAATIKDAPYLMSARTMEKSRLVLIPSMDVRDVFETDSRFARAVVSELAQCYRSVVKNTKDLKLRSSIERLANYILRIHMTHDRAMQFDLKLEKRRLASFLGMTSENLSRAIKSLRPYGVEIDGQRVTITDLADLEQLAKPSPLIDDYSI